MEKIYDKIVKKYRGGFCFEIASLFAWLLFKLKYEVRLVLADVWRLEIPNYLEPCTHLAILASWPNEQATWLVDVRTGPFFTFYIGNPKDFDNCSISPRWQVGFGDAPGAAIPWSADMALGAGSEAEDALDGYRYRIYRNETHFVVERCSVGLPGTFIMPGFRARAAGNDWAGRGRAERGGECSGDLGTPHQVVTRDCRGAVG